MLLCLKVSNLELGGQAAGSACAAYVPSSIATKFMAKDERIKSVGSARLRCMRPMFCHLRVGTWVPPLANDHRRDLGRKRGSKCP